MSRLHKAVLGIPQGTLGQLVFRIKKGIAYISTRPVSFMPGNEPDDIARRSRFGITCRFSKHVNSIPQLKKIWSLIASKGSSFNQIAKENYKHVTDSGVGESAVLTPFGGLGLHITSAVVTNTELQVEIDALLTDKINTALETKVRFISVLYHSGPKSVNTPAYLFTPVVSPTQDFDVETPIVFTVPLDSQESGTYDLYNNHKLFYVIVTEDENGKVYHFSKTCTV